MRTRLIDLSWWVLFAAILTALLFIILLWKDDVRQRNTVVELQSTLAPSLIGPPHAQKGDIVPSFEAAMGGRTTKITFDGHTRWLLFIFSSQCDACLSQVPAWNSIVQQVKDPRYKTAGILIDKAPLSIPPVDFEILTMPDISLQRAYRVVAVPLVMLVSERGKIQWIKYGTLTSEKSAELLSVIASGVSNQME